MLPQVIPIFPLTNVVLFPHVYLPLHIFEPRYRQMTADVLAGDRIIGMTLLQPGWQTDYDGTPPVYPIGCAGLITHSENLADGRYNIVLRGMQKFRITTEDSPDGDVRLYRQAHVEPIEDLLCKGDREVLQGHRRRLEALLIPLPDGADLRVAESMSDEDLVNALAQYLELEPLERQALLEREGLLARCASLVELLEIKVLASKKQWGGVH